MGLAEQTLGSAKHLVSQVQVLVEEGLQRTSASQALGHSKFENKRYYWCAWNIISFERENSGKKERKGWDIHGLSQNPTLASFLTSLLPNVWLGSLERRTWKMYYMIVANWSDNTKQTKQIQLQQDPVPTLQKSGWTNHSSFLGICKYNGDSPVLSGKKFT